MDVSGVGVVQGESEKSMTGKKDDSICLVNPPKNWVKPPMFDLVARGLENPRIIPFRAEAGPRGYNDVLGKVRGKDLIELIFTVPTVRVRYKKSEWRDETQFYLRIPLSLAARIGSKLLRLSRKYLKEKAKA